MRLQLACHILSFLVCTALPGAKDQPSVNDLPQSALQSAFQILRQDYIRREELTFEELNRAALAGLLERLSFGARLVPVHPAASPSKPAVNSELLAPDIAYLRPATVTEGEAKLLEDALQNIVQRQARRLILDLRATRSEGSFEEAALMLQCFIPQGDLMFKLRRMGQDEAELHISKRDPLWSGQVIVLVDGDTNNAAETIAAVLRQRGQALLIGERTRGAAVRYADVRLSDTVALRYASAELMLPNDQTVFEKGLTPDDVVHATLDEKRKAFEGSEGKSMSPFLVDKVRARFNERALVTNSNPELDDYIRRGEGQPLPGDDGQVRDVVTQRALDLLLAVEFTTSAKIEWASAPQSARPEPPEDLAIPKAVPSHP